ncbi:hypothetical protein C8F04DRAFT_1358698 [Mycena alexandri]|uniref:Uncharacterized protein n=1 Tax=Mycena alexandri TaxID=1745969 RepID=A0AAD6STS3_9AGAR|nr:hypothetical protein C8F04DRAFT_1402783 [Mycena alexandri]KAJ7032455.1 hypothetical protein C8F04DRAFT_1358698 [Mycena alexandri]
MFTNVLVFALAALTLVGAAPSSQTPMSVSCNVNFGAVPDVDAAADSFGGGIKPGRYRIINAAAPGDLRSYKQGEPIFRTVTREFPGPFIFWDVVPVGPNSFAIFNVGLEAPTFIDGDQIRCGNAPPAQYTISPVGQGPDLFSIKTRDGKVWGTEGNFGREEVRLRPRVEGPAEQWLFIPVEDFQSVHNSAF